MRPYLLKNMTALIHAIIASMILVVAFLLDPSGFALSGFPVMSFLIFILSWWLWRFPSKEMYRVQVLPYIAHTEDQMPPQQDSYIHTAWKLHLVFVIAWGWICAILFWGLATWIWLPSFLIPTSLFLLLGIVVMVVGWIFGGARIIQRILKRSLTTNTE